jgi:hypothetical protein
MTVSRRTVLKAGAASGALLLARPALAAPLGPVKEFSTSRRSRLFPGTRLVHADLHNHTLYSDGDGDPARAFASMRAAGVDAAALTDHATVSKALGEVEGPCSGGACGGVEGITEQRWEATRELADAATVDHSFTAVRGFEWSSPTLGHVNVWFTEDWIDPLSTNGNTTGEGLGQFLHAVPALGPALSPAVDAAVRATPTRGLGMKGFYDWLDRAPAPAPVASAVLSGGRDGLGRLQPPGTGGRPVRPVRLRRPARRAHRQHGGLQPGRGLPVRGRRRRQASPLVECLDAGWRVGLLGVSDEHGTDWGYPGRQGPHRPVRPRAHPRRACARRCRPAASSRPACGGCASAPPPTAGRWARSSGTARG